MHITFEELRRIKHNLPTGSIHKIASELNVEEQTVRNYFGAKKYQDDTNIAGKHIQPGPNGGFVVLQDTKILDLARTMIKRGES
ncbi:DNA-binding protein [Portibacter marinus]|uniref:DNA-binding protein n=1 Tax=Portibacter marinus TaxID=2898660 RepID=UPI001F263703|nr:DNA-binding protein [Portibacter marinus]